jgi:hypothetical protein
MKTLIREKTVRRTFLLASLILVTLISACSPTQPEPTITVTPSKTVRPSATIVLRPTHVPPRTSTPTITATPYRTPTDIPVWTLPTSSVDYDPNSDMTSECRRIIDKMYVYHADEGFEPSMYFLFLNHLRMEDGYQLDDVTFEDDWGGLSLVYARKYGDPAFTTYDEYLASLGEEVTDEKSWSGLYHSSAYLSKVIADGTPEGYFEFVTLAWLGDQYNLSWHGLYNDYKILCDASDLTYVSKDMNMFSFGDEIFDLPPDIKKNAANIDFTPVVVMDAESVIIRVVTFSKWEGFIEHVYILDKFNPDKIISAESYTIIKYDCGISF